MLPKNNNYFAGFIAPGTMTLDQADKPMKWFKFIIYFQLFFSAFVHISNCGLYLKDVMALRELKDKGYEITDTIIHNFEINADIATVISAGLAIFSIIVRFRLAKFRVGAPVLYYILIIVNILYSFMYVIVSKVCVGDYYIISGSTFSGIGSSIVLLVCNIVYFKKREYMFVN